MKDGQRDPKSTPPSLVTGHWGIGRDKFEVVINLDRERRGMGHVVFSPTQARQLAALLVKHADAADRAYQRYLKRAGGRKA